MRILRMPRNEFVSGEQTTTSACHATPSSLTQSIKQSTVTALEQEELATYPPPLPRSPTNIRSEAIIKTSSVSRLVSPISIKRKQLLSFHPATSPTTQPFLLSEASFPIAFS